MSIRFFYFLFLLLFIFKAFGNKSFESFQERCSVKAFQSMAYEDFFNQHNNGLSQTGIKLVKCFKEILREHHKRFQEAQFANMDSFYHAIIIARLNAEHVFLQGMPGGAKSLMVNFFETQEGHRSYKIQMHKSIQPIAIQGGVIFAQLDKGEYKINTENSLVHYKTASIDEIDKASASTLGSLLGALNERSFFHGDEEDKGELETCYATSNKFLPDIVESFNNKDDFGSGEALLNRFLFKMYIANWLDLPYMADLLNSQQSKQGVRSKKRKQQADFQTEEKSILGIGEWFSLVGGISDDLFILDEENTMISRINYSALAELLHEYRTLVNKKSNAARGQERPIDYYPSADLSTRLALKFISVIKASLFIDFLFSTESDENLEKWLENPVQVDTSSFWRLHLVLGTILGSENRLNCKSASLLERRKSHFEPDCSFTPKVESFRKKDIYREGKEKTFVEDLLEEKSFFSQKIKKLFDIYKVTAAKCLSTSNSDDVSLRLELVLSNKIDN